MCSRSPDNEIVLCYAQRLLNPFRGVTNIVRYQSAEAVTMDGVHWDIYVTNDALRQGLDATHNIQISDNRYGSWSQSQIGPKPNSTDCNFMLTTCQFAHHLSPRVRPVRNAG